VNALNHTAGKLAVAAVALAALVTVVALSFLLLFVIDFGAPTRPAWSTLTLVLIVIILPIGTTIVFLLKAADLISSGRLRRALVTIGLALLVPFIGCAIGSSLISMGVLP